MRKPSLLFALSLALVFPPPRGHRYPLSSWFRTPCISSNPVILMEQFPEYREFLKLHPEVAAIHSNLGAALAGLGRFEEALPEYRSALKLSPRLVGARLNLALVYYKMGKIDDAAGNWKK